MTPGQNCPHNVAEAAQFAIPTGGHVGDIRDCPKCGKPCYVRDGNYPEHDCTD
ncbi:hypothetical protein [Mycolicibacter kumamotonensis]|uniref:hypothetical protein n=1 Tax=Mycolicibacter kumamotonensis TaxID=354243 RepID=UPI0013FD8E78|nr:hypothetical protein [Mycolicibacter kumamotonensis]